MYGAAPECGATARGAKALMILLAGCLGVGSGGATCCLRSLVGDLFEGQAHTPATCLPSPLPPLGLGRIVALHYCTSTLYRNC